MIADPQGLPALPGPEWSWPERGRATGRCRSCQAGILWAITPSGKWSPLDLDGKPHWATCPNAAQHRRAAHQHEPGAFSAKGWHWRPLSAGGKTHLTPPELLSGSLTACFRPIERTYPINNNAARCAACMEKDGDDA